jgi:hypothetical protein
MGLLAYVFWHWKRSTVRDEDYETLQRGFHAAMRSAPPDGFIRSFTAAIFGASWVPDGGGAFEDWYLVQDFTALGHLNDAAISGARAAPHHAAAAAAAGGTAGVYGLRQGDVLRRPLAAHWFGKPPGMSYAELDSRLAPVVRACQGVLWMRQMTLGPAQEFCLQAPAAVELPPPFAPRLHALRPVWPDE